MSIHAAVQGGAVDAEQPGGFADIARGKLQRGGDIVSLLFVQMLVQFKVASLEIVKEAISVCAGTFRRAGVWRRTPRRCFCPIFSGRNIFQRIEFVLQLDGADCAPRIFGGEPDDDVAQFAGVAGKTILLPARAALARGGFTDALIFAILQHPQ